MGKTKHNQTQIFNTALNSSIYYIIYDIIGLLIETSVCKQYVIAVGTGGGASFNYVIYN